MAYKSGRISPVSSVEEEDFPQAPLRPRKPAQESQSEFLFHPTISRDAADGADAYQPNKSTKEEIRREREAPAAPLAREEVQEQDEYSGYDNDRSPGQERVASTFDEKFKYASDYIKKKRSGGTQNIVPESLPVLPSMMDRNGYVQASRRTHYENEPLRTREFSEVKRVPIRRPETSRDPPLNSGYIRRFPNIPVQPRSRTVVVKEQIIGEEIPNAFQRSRLPSEQRRSHYRYSRTPPTRSEPGPEPVRSRRIMEEPSLERSSKQRPTQGYWADDDYPELVCVNWA